MMSKIVEEPQMLRLSDGRDLCFQRYGAEHGRPLFVLHGFPGCRIQAALIEQQAVQEGVCLIGFDRPGFGRSSPRADRTILALADDVRQLADHLGHRQFGLLGISCGGAYALACTLRLPLRVVYTGLVAGIGPMDLASIRARQLPFLRMMFALARRSPWLASPLLFPDWLLFRANAARAVRVLSSMLAAPDRALLAGDHAAAELFGASLAEAYRQGLRAALVEASLIARARGFELQDIPLPVDVYQGDCDRHVPPLMGRYIADNIPQGRLHFFPGEGHLSILVNTAPDFLAAFARAFDKAQAASTTAPAMPVQAMLR